MDLLVSKGHINGANVSVNGDNVSSKMLLLALHRLCFWYAIDWLGVLYSLSYIEQSVL